MVDDVAVPERPLLLLPAVAGAFTVGAGLVHAAAVGTHEGATELAVLFAVTAVFQVLLGGAVTVRPERPALLGATLVNAGAAATWCASRLGGLPLVEGLGQRQPVGVQDVTATLLEVVAIAAAVLAFRPHRAPSVRGLSRVWAIALVPALVGMTAHHSHSEDEHHDGSDHHVAAGHSLASDPIFAGADTSHLSQAQLQAAKALIVTTRAAVLRAFPDEASVVRAGYRSIGDGRFPGTFEHFVNSDYLTDGRELDPDHVESIVMENTGAGKQVVSAMYILEMGKTMSDVPDIAGDLTAWHDHQNLCWDDSGIRLAGLLVNGRCIPRGTFHPTPPMLHVWLQDHPCGPFAGIDGHGTACTVHDHATAAAGRPGATTGN